MANYQLIFSPTGGTQRVAECLGCGLWNDAEEIDLLDPALEEGPAWTFSEEDVCLVAVPSFGGRVPAPAVRRERRCFWCWCGFSRDSFGRWISAVWSRKPFPNCASFWQSRRYGKEPGSPKRN